MRLKLIFERGGGRPRVAVWDAADEAWVPLHQAYSYMRSRTNSSDPELEEAVEAESVLPLLGPEAAGLR
jgi:hypothetical protein